MAYLQLDMQEPSSSFHAEHEGYITVPPHWFRVQLLKELTCFFFFLPVQYILQ